MSTAIAVFHGAFGRVCLYSMDRRMAPHAHREGHLIFHVQGPPAAMSVGDQLWPISPGQAVAVSPWQSHYFQNAPSSQPTLALVLYIRPAWFLEVARQVTASLQFGRVGIEVTDRLGHLVRETAATMLDPDADDPMLEDRLCALSQSAYDQSWQWTESGRAFIGPNVVSRDFRIRRSLRILQRGVGEDIDMCAVAREAGLSRPHFYKLFREQVGLTPNLYLNALRMERAIDKLSESADAVADIGFDLGFSSQASFSRFFIANGVVPPTAYRRCVQTPLPH
ncbi:AraC family transcriptional regulator [Jannaschia aquimarina]|uniref:TetD protein n=1 Tax=Jannaschia aquimarina TaxID=935700 RepID=A0A0D1CNB1_9RHOB|nr:AraC family transcriptional regulator [Jannaschia aquimarina]KIT16237.1 Transposon Tn10 TetD protein [Jannaschia aquimarina]SNT15559.1 transcriptional regulator, AraC family [Jannaschia aquimarina]